MSYNKRKSFQSCDLAIALALEMDLLSSTDTQTTLQDMSGESVKVSLKASISSMQYLQVDDQNASRTGVLPSMRLDVEKTFPALSLIFTFGKF